jgi:hypothetical protein
MLDRTLEHGAGSAETVASIKQTINLYAVARPFFRPCRSCSRQQPPQLALFDSPRQLLPRSARPVAARWRRRRADVDSRSPDRRRQPAVAELRRRHVEEARRRRLAVEGDDAWRHCAREIHYEPLPSDVRAIVIAAWQRGGMLPKGTIEEMMAEQLK